MSTLSKSFALKEVEIGSDNWRGNWGEVKMLLRMSVGYDETVHPCPRDKENSSAGTCEQRVLAVARYYLLYPAIRYNLEFKDTVLGNR